MSFSLRLALLTLPCMTIGCTPMTRIASSETITFQGGPAYRIVCNYAFSNCVDYAERKCHGPYEEISLAMRATKPPAPIAAYKDPDSVPTVGVYRGTLDFRCRRSQ